MISSLSFETKLDPRNRNFYIDRRHGGDFFKGFTLYPIKQVLGDRQFLGASNVRGWAAYMAGSNEPVKICRTKNELKTWAKVNPPCTVRAGGNHAEVS